MFKFSDEGTVLLDQNAWCALLLYPAVPVTRSPFFPSTSFSPVNHDPISTISHGWWHHDIVSFLRVSSQITWLGTLCDKMIREKPDAMTPPMQKSIGSVLVGSHLTGATKRCSSLFEFLTFLNKCYLGFYTIGRAWLFLSSLFLNMWNSCWDWKEDAVEAVFQDACNIFVHFNHSVNGYHGFLVALLIWYSGVWRSHCCAHFCEDPFILRHIVTQEEVWDYWTFILCFSLYNFFNSIIFLSLILGKR